MSWSSDSTWSSDEEAEFFQQERRLRKQTRADVGVQVGSPASMLNDAWVPVYWRARVLPDLKDFNQGLKGTHEDWIEWTDLVKSL